MGTFSFSITSYYSFILNSSGMNFEDSTECYKMHIRLSNTLSRLELSQQLSFYLKIMLKVAIEIEFDEFFDDEVKLKQLRLSLNQINSIVHNFLESLGGSEAYRSFEEMYNDPKNNDGLAYI